MDIEQCRNLEEVTFEDSVMHRLEGPGAGKSDIVSFIDRDGRQMRVVGTKDGLRKSPL